jgi:uncharacterized membrane protein YjjB (DUF3815 family)
VYSKQVETHRSKPILAVHATIVLLSLLVQICIKLLIIIGILGRVGWQILLVVVLLRDVGNPGMKPVSGE